MGRRGHQGLAHGHGVLSRSSGQPTEVDVRVPNILRFGVGAEIPVLPILHIILEGWYNVYDGGDFPEPDYGAAQCRRPLLDRPHGLGGFRRAVRPI